MNAMRKRIEQAVAKRQKILDFLVDHPHASTTVVAAGIGLEVAPTNRLMADMIPLGEVQKHGARRHSTYTACKTTTKPAEAIIHEIMRSKRPPVERTNERRNTHFQESKRDGMPGVYVNKPQKNKPHPNQGGQGAVRGRSGIGPSTIWGNW